MSVDKIQANYDELARVVARFTACAERSDELRRRIEGRLAGLEDGGWVGLGADSFFAEMRGEVLPAQLRMSAALRAAAATAREIAGLMAEAEEQAARLFGGGAAGGGGGGIGATDIATGVPNDKGTPREMAQLIELLNSRSNPITIIRNGDGEYLVLLKGTDATNMALGNNWISAAASGFEVTGTYERQVRAAIESSIPPGATIHFVGHSQGGIVSHNLVDNADFGERYTVESLTTIGASQSAPRRDGIEYHRFANSTDPVTFADGGLLRTVLSGGNVPRELQERMSMTPLDSGHHGIEAHATENYIEALRKTGAPSPSSINFSDWSGATEVSSVSTDMGGLQGGVWTGIDRTYDTARAIPLMAMNYTAERFTEHLPQPIRDGVDRFTDRVSDTVMAIPTPSQFLGGVVDVVGDGFEAGKSFLGGFF